MSSSEQQIDDAVAKRHVKNTDTAQGIQSADLDMNLHKIVGLEDPTGDLDAAHKKYVDDNIGPGSGDMTKAVYDTNDDGIVDVAATVVNMKIEAGALYINV